MFDMIETAARRLAAEISSEITHRGENPGPSDCRYKNTRLVSVFVRFGPLLNVIGIDYALGVETGIVFDLFAEVDDLASLTHEAIEAEARNIICNAVDCSYEFELGVREDSGYGPYSMILPAAGDLEPAGVTVDVPATGSAADRLRSELAACKVTLADLILKNRRLKRSQGLREREKGTPLGDHQDTALAGHAAGFY